MTIGISEIPTNLSLIKPEFRDALTSLLPTLRKIDVAKLDSTSGVTIDRKYVHIVVNPLKHNYAGLNVYIARKQLLVSFAEIEQYENHHSNYLEPSFIETIEKYLTGIRIRQSYSKSGRLLLREYFFSDGERAIGGGMYSFFARKRARSHNEVFLTFLSA